MKRQSLWAIRRNYNPRNFTGGIAITAQLVVPINLCSPSMFLLLILLYAHFPNPDVLNEIRHSEALTTFN
jgi:hypothetical protein